MKKKPLILIITDTHLSNKNIDLVIDIFKQAIEKTVKLGFDVLYHAGDVFDSRKHQTLATLNAWYDILDMLEEAGIKLRAIPGNHDKPDYFDEASYLDVYRTHPALELVRNYKRFPHGDIMIHMLPFFDEVEVYPFYLKKTEISKAMNQNIAITHIAVDGVRNNDGSEIEETFDKKNFKMFDKVLVGHYHDAQGLGNVEYIGSAFQKNFGEDDNKGMTLTYDDGLLERIELVFPRFKTVKVDLNLVTPDELEKEFTAHKNSEDNIRFKFSGTKEKISSIDRQKYVKAGIDVKTDQDDPEIDLDYAELIDFTGFDSKKILEEWGEFGEKHDISKDSIQRGLKRMKNNFKELA